MRTKGNSINVNIDRVYVLRSILDEAELVIQEFEKLPKVIKWLIGKNFKRVMRRLEEKLNYLPKAQQ